MALKYITGALLTVGIIILFSVLVAVVFTLPFMWLINYIFSSQFLTFVFGQPSISFWKAFFLVIFLAIFIATLFSRKTE